MTDDIAALLARAAKLSRLDMSESELAALVPRAGAIFAAFDKLAQVDTQGVEPLYTFREAIELRADEASAGLEPAALLANAPESESNHFVVPRAVGGDDVF